MLVDGVIDGQPRKLVVQASRNGYFFVLDRATGKQIRHRTRSSTPINWAKGYDAKGQPHRRPRQVSHYRRRAGVARLRAAPPTGRRRASIPIPACSTWARAAPTACTTSPTLDEHPQGWGGLDSGAGQDGNALLAIDYHTGKIVWRHDWPSGGGITNNLTTAGKLLFTSNGHNLIAFDPATGKILWHSTLMASPSAGPITYQLDGKQYLLVAAGDSLYTFQINDPMR